MEYPEVFTNFLRNTLRFTTQKKIDITTNFVESFGDLISVNDGDIDTFVKDTHSVNNARAAAKRILIRKNITQGLKSMFLDLNDRELWNDFSDEVALHGKNVDHISIIRNIRAKKRNYKVEIEQVSSWYESTYANRH